MRIRCCDFFNSGCAYSGKGAFLTFGTGKRTGHKLGGTGSRKMNTTPALWAESKTDGAAELQTAAGGRILGRVFRLTAMGWGESMFAAPSRNIKSLKTWAFA
jgi:hypothetical protein